MSVRRIVTLTAGALLLGAGAFALYLWIRPDPEATSARLTVLSGTVRIERGNALRAAGAGTLLQPGDVVSTRAAAQAAIGWPNGAVTRLDSGTRAVIEDLSYKDSAWVVTARLLEGRTWTHTSRLGQVRVRGGSGFVAQNSGPAQFEVDFSTASPAVPVTTVIDWSGSVQFLDSPPISLTGGQWTSTASTAPANAPRPITGPQRQDPFTVFNLALDAGSRP